MHWARWGDPDRVEPISAELTALVEAFLGPSQPSPSVAREAVRLQRCRLTGDQLAALGGVVGVDQVHDDRTWRIARTRGKSTSDLIRMRAGEADDAPDAVVRPADHAQVQAVVDWCVGQDVALVPFGGGTSVVGGLAATGHGHAAVLALDLARLAELVSLDEVSGLARLGAGLLGPAAEALLEPYGLRIGHYPQSFAYASLGGFAATRSAGQSSAGYGRFDSMVMGLRMATPRGELVLGTSPANAAGPDLRQVALGSEGALGVITEVTVGVHPIPEASRYEGWQWESFAAGIEAMRVLARSLPRGRGLPSVLRLSDESESAVNLAGHQDIGGPVSGGCTMIVGHEGTGDQVARASAGIAAELVRLGGTPIGPGPGEAWVLGRFEAPYLRDGLLDVGVLVETFETAAFWSQIPALYAAVKSAVEEDLAAQGAAAMVLCHVSHVYGNGASLYFTVATRQLADPLAQWHSAKSAALRAIVRAGASITHHHGVGRDHRDWLVEEIGQVGVEMLRGLKQALDPTGVLNPGVLIDDQLPIRDR